MVFAVPIVPLHMEISSWGAFPLKLSPSISPPQPDHQWQRWLDDYPVSFLCSQNPQGTHSPGTKTPYPSLEGPTSTRKQRLLTSLLPAHRGHIAAASMACRWGPRPIQGRASYKNFETVPLLQELETALGSTAARREPPPVPWVSVRVLECDSWTNISLWLIPLLHPLPLSCIMSNPSLHREDYNL